MCMLFSNDFGLLAHNKLGWHADTETYVSQVSNLVPKLFFYISTLQIYRFFFCNNEEKCIYSMTAVHMSIA